MATKKTATATTGVSYDEAIYNAGNCAEKGNYWTRPGWTEPICGIPDSGNPCRLQYLDGSVYEPSAEDVKATDWAPTTVDAATDDGA